VIRTDRLLLRRWREQDRDAFAVINADPEVAYWMGGPALANRAVGAIDRYNRCIDVHGYGRFAVERVEDGALIGAVGVMPVTEELPLQGFELGWRLARHAWGQGYATEAAAAALADGLGRMRLAEVIAFTPRQNLRSIAVMRRIGMTPAPERDFDHPALAPDHPLRGLVVYAARP
jgi:RimJ/RimL family protein N-acetyltransferase